MEKCSFVTARLLSKQHSDNDGGGREGKWPFTLLRKEMVTKERSREEKRYKAGGRIKKHLELGLSLIIPPL